MTLEKKPRRSLGTARESMRHKLQCAVLAFCMLMLPARGFPVQLPANPETKFTYLLGHEGVAYFSAKTATSGVEMWAYDVSRDKVRQVTEVRPGPLSGEIFWPFSWKGGIYFAGPTSSPTHHGALSLWRTDNSERGASPVSTQMLWTDDWKRDPLFSPVHGRLYFVADDGKHGQEWWSTDGTPDGTRLLKDIHPPPNGAGSPNRMVPVGDLGVFRATRANGPGELWVTDGHSAGTRQLMVPGLEGVIGHGGGIYALGAIALFIARGADEGIEWWVTNGTVQGTERLVDLRKGPRGAEIAEVTPFGDGLLFRADDGIHGPEVWFTDGTQHGTRLVREIVPGAAGGNPYKFAAYGKRAFFVAETPETGRELWVTDGTRAGTRLLKDLAPGAEGSIPYAIAVGPNGAFFSARRDDVGEELWFSDGTPAGTRLVRDICPGPGSSEPYNTIVVDGIACFEADDGLHGAELWRSDGTRAGTRMVKDIAVPEDPPPEVEPHHLIASGNIVSFVGRDAKGIWRWCRSDGTPAGTFVLTDAIGSLRRSSFADLRVVENRFVLTVEDPARGETVYWSTQGTRETTTRLEQAPSEDPPVETSFVADIAAKHRLTWLPGESASIGNLTLFSARDNRHGMELWACEDGVDEPYLVRDLYPGPASSQPEELTVSNDRVFFRAETPEYGFEPFVSDGTPSGTVMLRDFVAGPRSSHPDMLRVAGNWLYFAAHVEHTSARPVEREIWRVRGDQFEIFDIGFGYVGSDPEAMVMAGDTLFLSATIDPKLGKQLVAIRGISGPQKPAIQILEIGE